MIKIKTVPECPKRILQCYQADQDIGIDFTGKFDVKTKDKTFSTHRNLPATWVGRSWAILFEIYSKTPQWS